MNDTVIGYITYFIFQVMIGLILGLCWNYGLADLGVPALGVTNAITLWLGIVIAFSILSYIAVSVQRNIPLSKTQKSTEYQKKSDEEKNN
jgi:hypothetical protein